MQMSMKHDLRPARLATTPKLRNESGAIVLFGTIAALYFTREILIPFAFALTLMFLLTPMVALIERLRIGRVAAILTAVLVSIAASGSLGLIIASQLVDVVRCFDGQLPNSSDPDIDRNGPEARGPRGLRARRSRSLS